MKTRHLHYPLALLALIVAAIYPINAHAFPADYDRDGKNDLVVWRPSTGNWHIYTSKHGTGVCPPCFGLPQNGECVDQWGLPGDIPISGDYDGDGYADLTVWRPGTATWWIQFSSTCGGISVVAQEGPGSGYSISGNVLPDEADFDNDASDWSNLMLYDETPILENPNDPPTGAWWGKLGNELYFRYWPTIVTGSAAGFTLRPASGNIVSDPAMQEDLAAFRSTTVNKNSVWFAYRYNVGGAAPLLNVTGFTYGVLLPYASGGPDVYGVAADVGGSPPGLNDFVTWDRRTTDWHIRYSGSPTPPDETFDWGRSYDEPLAGDFDGDGIDEIVVWRDAWDGIYTGAWFVREPSSGSCPSHLIQGGASNPLWCYRAWGLPGDIPVH